MKVSMTTFLEPSQVIFAKTPKCIFAVNNLYAHHKFIYRKGHLVILSKFHFHKVCVKLKTVEPLMRTIITCGALWVWLHPVKGLTARQTTNIFHNLWHTYNEKWIYINAPTHGLNLNWNLIGGQLPLWFWSLATIYSCVDDQRSCSLWR